MGVYCNVVSSELAYRFADAAILSAVPLPELTRLDVRWPTADTYSVDCLPSTPSLRSGRPSATVRPTTGRMTLGLEKTSQGMMLRFPSLAVFALTGDLRRVAVQAEPGVNQETVRHLLLDQVLPRLLAHHGRLIVHGAAVEIDGRAIVFVGDTGAGKSTLAASFSSDGYRLLCDDGLLLTADALRSVALPTYQSLRLWPDSVTGVFTGSRPRTAPMAHYSTKQRVLIDDVTAPNNEPLPTAALYVLSSNADTDTTAIARLSPRDGCMAVIRNAFQLDVTDPERAAGLMAKAGDVSQRVPVFALSTPRCFSALTAVRAAVLDHQGQWATSDDEPKEGR